MACDGKVISKSVIFEYKSPIGASTATSRTYKNASYKERDLRTILLRKLECLDICTIDDKDIFLEQDLDNEVRNVSNEELQIKKSF